MSGNDGRYGSNDHGFGSNDHGYDSNDHGFDPDDHGYDCNDHGFGLGVGLGAGLGVGNLQKNDTDYQRVKCQVWDVRVTCYLTYTAAATSALAAKGVRLRRQSLRLRQSPVGDQVIDHELH